MIELSRVTVTYPDASRPVLSDVSLLVETGKLEKLVDQLVAERGTAAKATIDASGFIYHSSFVMLAVMTVGLIVLAAFVSEWVVRRLARQLGGEPAYAKEIASRIAAGDLSNQIKLGRKDKSSVLYALSDMQSGLATTVSDIASSADAIATASGEISMGNLDLSQRTEQQAMALERTAISMEQLTSTVRQNADNAKQASTLANNASEIAEKGGAVVGRSGAGLGLDDGGCVKEGRLVGGGGKLGAELAEGEVLGLLFHQAESGDVPERRGTADAEDNLIAFGGAEELAQPVADRTHQVLDRCLPVGGAQDGGRCGGQSLDLFRTDLGRSSAEASVFRQEVGRYGDAVVAHVWLQRVSAQDGSWQVASTAPSTPQFCLTRPARRNLWLS